MKSKTMLKALLSATIAVSVHSAFSKTTLLTENNSFTPPPPPPHFVVDLKENNRLSSDSTDSDTTETIAYNHYEETSVSKNKYPSLHHAAVVRYPTYADCLFELNSSEFLKDANYTVTCRAEDGSSQSKPMKKTDHQVLFKNLKINTNYTLLYEAPDTTYTVGNFTTSKEILGTLPTPKTLFYEIGAFSSLHENLDPIALLNYILGLSNVNPYQRASFLQDYFLDDEPIVLPPSIRFQPMDLDLVRYFNALGKAIEKYRNTKVETCNCKLLSEGNSTVELLGGYLNTDEKQTTSSTADTHASPNNVNDDGFYAADYRELLGPSKYVHIGIGATNAKRHAIEVQSYNSIKAPYYARISYNWLCSGRNTDAAPCCTKYVDFDAEYQTLLKVDLNNGDGSGTYSLASTVQDIALVTVSQIRPGSNQKDDADTIKVLDIGRAIYKRKCGREFNTAFYDASAQIAIEITKAAFKGSKEEIVVAAINGVASILKTKTYLYEGECGTESFAEQLVKLRGTRVYLQPGRIKTIQMLGGCAIESTTKNNRAGGKHSSGEVRGDFYMVSTSPCEDEAFNPCGSNIANAFIVGGPNSGYILSSSKHNYIHNVNNFYSIRKINHNMDRMWGTETYICAAARGNEAIETSENTTTTGTTISIKTARVFDLQGKLLLEANNQNELNTFLNALPNTLMVIVNSVFDDGSTSTIKFYNLK